MRYYKIVLSDPVSGKVRRTYSSFENGKNIPGALDVELDIPVYALAAPMGSGFVHVRGVPLSDVGQASDFNGAAISVYAGMQKGLPLANPAQAGLIAQGYVFQAFGNWIGTEQSVDFIIQSATGTSAEPKNLILNWKKGTTLANALASTLSTAFPDYAQNINISPNLVLPADEVGYYQTLGQLAAYAKSVSASIINKDSYQGVDVVISETTVSAFDGSSPGSPTQIAFTDMIGQPTWIDPLTVQVKLVMRADLAVGDSIKFPPALVTTAPGSTSPLINAKSTFQGTFQIKQERHVGAFRQADAASWVTIVDAFSAGTG